MLHTLTWNLLLTAGLAVLLAPLSRLPWMQRRPALIHWLWLLLLIKLVTPPLISVPLPPTAANGSRPVVETTLSNTQPHPEGVAAHEFAAGTRLLDKAVEIDEFHFVPEPHPSDFAGIAHAPGSSDEPSNKPANSFLRFGSSSSGLAIGTTLFPYVSVLVAVSILGTFTLLILYAFRGLKFNRWLKRASSDDSTLHECCAELASEMNIRQQPRGVIVDTRTTPLLWGWGRPVVAVPRQLVDELQPSQLRSILAHELAHLARRDHWANLFVCLVKALMWWNPVVWWADRELRVAQEMCCDAIAIERCKANRSSYAATLLKTLDFVQPPVASNRLALGMGSRGTILRRFEMIGEREIRFRTSRWAMLGLFALGTALACMPVRGQDEKPTTGPAPTSSEANTTTPAKAQTGEKPDQTSEKSEPTVEKTLVELLNAALSEKGQDSDTKSRNEWYSHDRPRGNCSISGKVVCAETGEPLKRVTVYLFYAGTHSPLFVNVKDDGTFVLKDIPAGPHLLRTLDTPGYQTAIYNPEGKPSHFAQFSLEEGEHRKDVVLKAKQAYRVSGKVRDAGGAVPEDASNLSVSALVKTGTQYDWEQGSSVDRENGSFSIDGLDGRPVYLRVSNRTAETQGGNWPPVFYPSTFSPSKAEQIVFDEKRAIEDIDITLRTEGGSTLEGKVLDEDGNPIPEAFVVVQRQDTTGGSLTAYTDKDGRYRIQGLGDGEFLVHLDAAHRGFVRLRTPFELEDAETDLTRDFTLAKGVMVSGKFVDRDGNDWQIGRSHGYAAVPGRQSGGSSVTYHGLFNKYASRSSLEPRGYTLKAGEGEYRSRSMVFPTKNTFCIQGMMPGRMRLGFHPKKDDQEVLEIRHQGKDILGSYLETTPGDVIDDIVIVIGKVDAATTQTGVRTQRVRTFGDRLRGNCSLSGKVISDETGEPVTTATVYLFYMGTHSGLFVNVAGDGTFLMKDIPTGPFSLTTTNTAGYRDLAYDPEGKSGPFPQFSLEEREHRSNIVFGIKKACQIRGKVLDEQGNVPECVNDLTVLAWVQRPDGTFTTEQARVNRSDGSFLIDRLGKTPVYVMAVNWKANRKDTPYPPIYYPSTFNRDDAKQITFDDECKVENVDITLVKEGGLVLEGKVVDESGKPVPEAFVVVHRRDMYFDFVTDYTDENGRYRIHGLGKGEFLVHVDAAHRGLVRIRTPFDLDGSVAETHKDFTLPLGVTISGKLVDEQGKKWQMARSFGSAAIMPDSDTTSEGQFSLSRFRNKFGPKDVNESSPGSFSRGEGWYRSRQMFFPTSNTFLIQGMMPGQTKIIFSPKEEDQEVLEILCEGKDIKDSEIETKAGKDLDDVTIVIGKKRPEKAADASSKVLALKDGETRRLKVGKNDTPVAEISLTPRLADNVTSFELEAFDADGKAIDGTKVSLQLAFGSPGDEVELGEPFRVEGKDVAVVASLAPTRRGDDLVDVQVKISFTPMPVPEE